MDRDVKRAAFVTTGIILFLLSGALYIGIGPVLLFYSVMFGFGAFVAFLFWLSGRLFK
jgi:hypothetical protein